jgi:hypothetical protein
MTRQRWMGKLIRGLFFVAVPMLLALLVDTALAPCADAAEVSVDAIMVAPASPGPSALCKLKVRLKNGGTQTVSYFAFKVKIDGQDVPLYKMQLYVVNIDPRTAGELELYNFYSPSVPKSFDVQVTLAEAQWVQVKKEGTAITTTPSGPVAGLPTSDTLSVRMSH